MEQFRAHFSACLIFVTVVSVLIGAFGMANALKQCSNIKLRFTFNVLICGAWVLYLVLGAVLVRVAVMVPGQVNQYLNDKNVDAMSAELRFLAAPVSIIDTNFVDEPSRFMCSYFCPCEE